MSDLQTLFNFVLSLYKMEFTIFGFTLSFWAILVYVIVGSLVIYLLAHAVRSIFYV